MKSFGNTKNNLVDSFAVHCVFALQHDHAAAQHNVALCSAVRCCSEMCTWFRKQADSTGMGNLVPTPRRGNKHRGLASCRSLNEARLRPTSKLCMYFSTPAERHRQQNAHHVGQAKPIKLK
jgi:hypothetical protein